MHTYKIDEKYINNRASENINKYDNNEYKLLKIDYLKIDNQNNIKKI